jgi:heme oxygenase
LIATEAEFYWKEKKRRSVKISKIKRRAFEPLQVFEGAMLTSAVLFKQSQWYDYPPKFILAPSGKLRHDRY